MSEIADKAVDLAADAVAEVSEQAEVAEQAIRSLKGVKFAYAFGGAMFGAAVGGFVGFKLAAKRAETKWTDILDERVEEEVSDIRAHYRSKALALENTVEKPMLEDLVRDKGYASHEDNTKPPLAVTPPAAVVEAAEAAREEAEETPSVKVNKSETRNVFRDRDAQPEDRWDYERERRRRSPKFPYVIHVDEQEELGYETNTLTYYEGDDVLCRDDDSVIGEGERDKLVGEKNMVKFGHGSEDRSKVFVRNDELELQFEIIRSPNSYAEEVHGLRKLKHSSEPRRRERHVFDDE